MMEAKSDPQKCIYWSGVTCDAMVGILANQNVDLSYHRLDSAKIKQCLYIK